MEVLYVAVAIICILLLLLLRQISKLNYNLVKMRSAIESYLLDILKQESEEHFDPEDKQMTAQERKMLYSPQQEQILNEVLQEYFP